MLLFIVLATATVIQGAVISENEEKKCNLVKIDDVYHEIEELKTDIDRPYLLTVDYSTNTVYFSYSINKDDDVFKTAYINLKTKEFTDLSIDNGFAQAIDQKNHDVYIGGDDGIYKFNHKTKATELYGAKGANVWSIFFKDILYYSVFPSQFLYTYINGESVRYKDLEDTKVDQFIIDNEDDIFFTNATGLFSQKKGTKDAKLYQELTHDGVRGLTTDINGNPYVCLPDGIYKVNKSEFSLRKILEIDDAFGLAFDNDNNIVYSDATKLIRLKPNKDKTC